MVIPNWPINKFQDAPGISGLNLESESCAKYGIAT